MSIQNGDIVNYEVAGSVVEVKIEETYYDRYGTRHLVSLVNQSVIDGVIYSKGSVFDGDIYSLSNCYTVSITNK